MTAQRLPPPSALRRSFAAAWGEIGAAWGVAPSTATVQGYLLVSDGPRTEPEVRRALGMSHRAASLALAQCEEWGLIERAEGARRSGQRGPAATAWAVVDDHWEWFRRVAKARKERETDPVLPVIARCVTQARDAAADPTGGIPSSPISGNRFAALLDFVRRFDRGVEMFVRGDARAIEDVFAALPPGRCDTSIACGPSSPSSSRTRWSAPSRPCRRSSRRPRGGSSPWRTSRSSRS